MPPPPTPTEQSDKRQTPATPLGAHLEQIRDILARHDIDADPAEVGTHAAELARHDAGNAQYQAGHAGGMTVKLLGHLRTVLGLAGPVAVFLLQPIPEIPPLSRYALAAFVLTGVSTYLYTFWTGRPRIARIPGAEASGWLGVVGIPTSERTPERYLEHYVLRAITPIRAYAAEAADNGDIAHGRHLRNQHSNLGLAAVMLTGVVCAVLLVLRW